MLLISFYDCFTALYNFLVHSEGNQLHVHIPSFLGFLPIEVTTECGLDSLCCTVGSC